MKVSYKILFDNQKKPLAVIVSKEQCLIMKTWISNAITSITFVTHYILKKLLIYIRKRQNLYVKTDRPRKGAKQKSLALLCQQTTHKLPVANFILLGFRDTF